MAAIPPTNPHHLASAYNSDIAGRIAPPSRAPTPAAPAAPAAPATAAPVQSRPPEQPSRAHHVQPHAQTDARAPQQERIARLVAAVVPGGIDFDAPAPQPTETAGALPFYPHPAQRQAAATQIHAHMGRSLDVQA